MTRVEFFFNVEDKLQKLAELSEKAVAKSVRVMVLTADDASSNSVQQFLWQQPLQFLPNHRVDDALAVQSPIVIGWQTDRLVHDDVLINLQHPQSTVFSRFRRLIEIVGVDEADKVQARERYKFYRDRGYEIKSYDARGKAL
jgi:DNA polymerase-3 subunit chi